MKIPFYVVALVLLVSAACHGALAAQPNIILIVADDMGYSDLQCYGGKAVPTPHLDALASSGIKMSRFYASSAVCTPTRASILTGRYPLRYDIRTVFPDDDSHLPRGVTTLPKLLHSAGYSTAHVGKWHLGGLHLEDARDRAHSIPGPREHGFDQYLSQLEEQPLRRNLAAERRLYREGGTCLLRNDEQVPAEDPYYKQHLTDIIGTEAIRLVESFHQQGKPFFLNIWHLVPHAPYEPGSEPHYQDTSAAGLTEDQHCFRSMVAHMDAVIGRLLEKLDELGIRNNTLVVFTSDNGGAFEADNGPLKGGKADLHEGGIRVPMIASWPGKIPAGQSSASIAGSIDLLPTLCAAAGVAVPADAQMDGINLLQHLATGSAINARGSMFWQLDSLPIQRHTPKPEPYATEAVMNGRWKLLTQDSQPLALFDLDVDPGEASNMLDRHPDIVAQMAGQVREFLDSPRDRSGFPPKPGPRMERENTE